MTVEQGFPFIQYPKNCLTTTQDPHFRKVTASSNNTWQKNRFKFIFACRLFILIFDWTLIICCMVYTNKCQKNMYFPFYCILKSSGDPLPRASQHPDLHFGNQCCGDLNYKISPFYR